MPFYEYQASEPGHACKLCAQRFEQLRRLSDPPLTTCPQCGGAVIKLISAPAVGAMPATVSAYLLPDSSAGYTPSETHANVCAQNGGVFDESYLPQFAAQPWRALRFQPGGKFRYRYAWLLAQQSTSTEAAVAYAHALGDLNCDGRYAVWRMFVTELRSGSDQVLRVTGPAMFQGDETD